MKQDVILVSKMIQQGVGTGVIVLQFNAAEGQGNYTAFTSTEEAETFKLGAKYTLTLEPKA